MHTNLCITQEHYIKQLFEMTNPCHSSMTAGQKMTFRLTAQWHPPSLEN